MKATKIPCVKQCGRTHKTKGDAVKCCQKENKVKLKFNRNKNDYGN